MSWLLVSRSRNEIVERFVGLEKEVKSNCLVIYRERQGKSEKTTFF